MFTKFQIKKCVLIRDIMSCEIIKSLEELNSEIEEQLVQLDQLITLKKNLGTQQARSIQELQSEKHGLIAEQVDQENLSGRKEEVRRKFSVLDVIVKNDADKITEEMKGLIKVLNVKTSVEQCIDNESDNFLEFKVEFPDMNCSYATFLYDPCTEDFDLSALHPSHSNFKAMKDFVRSTGDIAGFLNNFRRYVKSTN